MIEAGAQEVPEQQMIDAIFAAHELNQKVIAFIDTIVAECGKPKHEYESCAVPEELFEAIKEIVPPAQMEEAVFTDEKQVREENIRQITEKLTEAFAEKEEWLEVLPVSEEDGAQDDPEGSQASGRQSHRSDPSAGGGSRPDPQSSRFCYVYPWTDPDLYHYYSGASV